MKNFLMKLNMAVIFLVVLFANISFADDIKLIDGNSITLNFSMYADENGAYREVAEKGVVYEIKFSKNSTSKNQIDVFFDFFNENKTSSSSQFVASFSVPSDKNGTTRIPFIYEGPSMQIAITRNVALKSLKIFDSNNDNMYGIDLISGKTYYIEISNQELITWMSEENPKDEYLVFSSPNGSQFYGKYKQDGDMLEISNDSATDSAGIVESIITRLFLALGDVFLAGIKAVFGSDLTVDNLIFNRYEQTKLTFFSEESSEITNVLKTIVNYWYKVLTNVVLVLYIIILIYIGIMIVLSSGSPKQDKAKAYFVDWVVGLVILMFLPYYGFPLLFKANDALVDYVSNGTTTLKTYFSLSQKYGVSGEVKGGDSYTALVETIEKKVTQAKVGKAFSDIIAGMQLAQIKTQIQVYLMSNLSISSESKEKTEDEINSIINNAYSSYVYYREFEGKSSEEAYTSMISELNISTRQKVIEGTDGVTYSKLIDYLEQSSDSLMSAFEGSYLNGEIIEEGESDLEGLQKDIMGTMRSLAGETLRLVYAIIWFVLIFQLLGLTILYYKRIFIIALLIAIFPLIMLFYCVDKMADGSAQTFSMWMKEFLSNIFIQTVHAIIYAVLVDLGLRVYTGGTDNWILLVTALLLILPAESIMKEIFNLNGSTLSKVSGTFSKAMLGVAALSNLARAGKTGRDSSIKSANDRRMQRLQNSQNRADAKARTRQLESTYEIDKDKYGGARGKLQLAKDKMQGNVSYRAVPGGKSEGFREKLYHGATSARQAYAKAAPHIGQAVRASRNVAAITTGALIAASGGDVESLAKGAAIAKGLSGKTKDLKEAPNLKTELQSAYKRKKD